MANQYKEQWRTKTLDLAGSNGKFPSTQTSLEKSSDTYYNLPMLKKAHWKWQIVLYFFFGGIAGGSYFVTALARHLGFAKDTSLIRTGRYLSLGSLIVSPILLIWDLGRPQRFLHMLRVLKFRSVMSLGSWGLTIFGLFSGVTAAHQMAQDGLFDWFSPLARLMKSLPVTFIEAIGSFFGLFVAAYTGVLLSSTAVPIWARARHILGPLFMTSGLSTALSAISLIMSLGHSKKETMERLDRAEMATMAAELGLVASLIPVLGPLGKPFFKGRWGAIFNMGAVGMGLMLPLLSKVGFRIGGKTPSAKVTGLTSVLALLGGLLLRYSWIGVGRTSADDPKAAHLYNEIEWRERSRS